MAGSIGIQAAPWRLTAAALLLSAAPAICAAKVPEAAKSVPGFAEFVPRYNQEIRDWIETSTETVRRELAGTEAKLEAEADPAKRVALEAVAAEARKELAGFAFRQGLGDYFAFRKPEDLPADLNWVTGMDQPEIGDPRAGKGGVFNDFITTFPATLRPFGAVSNGSFRAELYDNVELPLVTLHPSTGAVIPGVAKRWAIGKDDRTVYFEIDPESRFNDGVAVQALDFMVAAYLRLSEWCATPYEKQYFREQLAQIAVYDERTLSITLANAKPRSLMPYYASLSPAASHFYDEFGPDFEQRYDWRVPPTTGAYRVEPEDIVKGVSITLSRAPDWWAMDHKYYRHRFNPDQIVYRVVRDPETSREQFRAGKIDVLMASAPDVWEELSRMPEAGNGLVERYTWYNQFPRPPWGLYLNTAKSILADRNVRTGLAHAMNWDLVLKKEFGDDYSRLPGFVAGYGDLVNPKVQPREFSVERAIHSFKMAGYTVEGPNGILRTPTGRRLEVSVTFPSTNPITGNAMEILRDEARRAGVELRLDGLDFVGVYNKQMKKEHEMVYAAWSVQPPFPRFYEYFHSRNAYDEFGKLRTQTNNVFSFRHAEMDRLTVTYRDAATLEEKKRLGYRIQEIVHDEALFIPGQMREFERLGCWRWIRWPDTEETRFCPKRTDRPLESHVHWIDAARKRETEEAIGKGTGFPEVNVIIGDRRAPEADAPSGS